MKSWKHCIGEKTINFHSDQQLRILADRIKKEWITSSDKAKYFLSHKLWQTCVADKVISILNKENHL